MGGLHSRGGGIFFSLAFILCLERSRRNIFFSFLFLWAIVWQDVGKQSQVHVRKYPIPSELAVSTF